MANATPHVGQVYRDNNGKGHRLARIIAIRNGRVFLERGRTRVQRWSLSLDFFCGPSCGWRVEPGA